MIRRFFTFFVVFLMLVNQGLCLAHMHHRHVGGEPEGHDSRPHFHLRGHVHHAGGHGHRHGNHEHPHHSRSDAPNASEHSPVSPCICLAIGDHDSDAVYGGETATLAVTGNFANILPDKDMVAGLAILRFEHRSDGLLHTQASFGESSFLSDVACPIYLRALSLRL